MDYKVRWTKRADTDFDWILDHLNEYWSKEVKERFIISVYRKIELVSRFPKLGFSVFPIKRIRAILVTQQIRMYYRIKKNEIIILTFFDTRQDPARLNF